MRLNIFGEEGVAWGIVKVLLPFILNKSLWNTEFGSDSVY